MAFPSFLSKIKLGGPAGGSLLNGFLKNAKLFFAELFNIIRTVIHGLLNKVPEGKRRFAAVSSVAVLLLFFFAALLLSAGRTGGRGAADMAADSAQALPDVPRVPSVLFFIPPEELFLPEEPDFLPGVLLQERRQEWTVDDIISWWRDPLRGGEQIWRELIENTVDNIMESIP